MSKSSQKQSAMSSLGPTGSSENLASSGRSNSRGSLAPGSGVALGAASIVASGGSNSSLSGAISASGGLSGAGPAIQGDASTVIANMDDILDKLRCLDYQRNFCKPNNVPPFHKFYFLVPAANANEQFFHFALLVTWLMKICGQQIDPPGQFDDPNAVSANIAAELKKLGIPFEISPTKLKQGYGDSVLYVLQVLVDITLAATKFVFQKPVHKIDDYPEEAEVDTNAEVTTDAVEDETKHHEEEEEQPYFDMTQQNKQAEETKSPGALKPKVDPNNWKLEVERVAPMLKVQMLNDNKDWRVHLDHVNHHQSIINKLMTDTHAQLSKLQTEIEKTLEKIASREKYINTQFEPQIEQYRTLQDQSSDLKQKYGVANSNVNELTNELSRISEDLDSVKSKMDDLGSGMTDSKPLVAIKQGVVRLKAELKQTDLRIGVIQHTLLHAKLKNKGPIGIGDSPSFSIQVLSLFHA